MNRQQPLLEDVELLTTPALELVVELPATSSGSSTLVVFLSSLGTLDSCFAATQPSIPTI